jgi:hypothetical protein
LDELKFKLASVGVDAVFKVTVGLALLPELSKYTSSPASGTAAPDAPPEVLLQLVISDQLPEAPPTQYFNEEKND